jgi:hypothetical protein
MLSVADATVADATVADVAVADAAMQSETDSPTVAGVLEAPPLSAAQIVVFAQFRAKPRSRHPRFQNWLQYYIAPIAFLLGVAPA